MRLFDLDRQLGPALERQGHRAEPVGGIADVVEVVRLGVVVQHDPTEADYLDYIRDPANGFRSMSLSLKGGTELSVKVE